MIEKEEEDETMKNDKAIVFITDDMYIDYLPVALVDAWEACDGKVPIYVIFEGGTKVKNIDKIGDVAEKYGIDMRTSVLPMKHVDELKRFWQDPDEPDISAFQYAKCLLNEALPKHIKYAYYLDIDILIMRRFPDFLSIEPEQTIAVVDQNQPNEAERLLGTPGRYFSTGVMIVNLERWRKTGVTAKLKKIVKERSDELLNGAQDALFLALHYDWDELPLIYNFYLMPDNPYVKNTKSYDWDPAEIKPVIVHYCGPWKPWNGDRRANTYRMWRDKRKKI